jgi:ribosomal protein L34E
MDWDEVRDKAVLWMIRRGWKSKLAKKKGFEQSLFEHTLIQLDVLLSLFPLLQRKEALGLSEEEEKVLWAATLAHDVGKETDAWQAYILGQGPAVGHCIPELAREALRALMEEYGWGEATLPEAISSVLLHMRNARTPTMVLSRAIAGHSLERWKMLAEITVAIDNLTSANGLFAGLASLERGTLGPHLKTTFHQIVLRGVSTVLLHKAAVDAFMEAGWLPLVHYPNGTIYAAGAQTNIPIPDRGSILQRLAREIEKAMGSDFAQRVVGNYTASPIPKPDLFDYREIREYLLVAASRVGRVMFRKKKATKRREVLNRYLIALCQKQESRCDNPSECKRRKTCRRPYGLLENMDLEYQSDRLSRAHPEMMVFYVFRTMFSDKLLDYQEFVLTSQVAERLDKSFLKRNEEEKIRQQYEKAVAKEKRAIVETLREKAKGLYDKTFGDEAFVLLEKAAYPDPAEAMAFAIDMFWALPCSRLMPGDDDTPIEVLPDDKRLELLVNTLAEIADEAFSILDEENRPKRIRTERVAESFLQDLVFPAEQVSFEELVKEQIEAYRATKPVARKAEGQHLCPICNRPFTGGTNARANFLNNPESHTNRAPSHGRPGYIVICDACKFERFLQQQILEDKPAQMMVLIPRMNIGYRSGEVFKSKALQIWNLIAATMSEDNPDPHERISFSLTGEIARRLPEKALELVTPEELVQAFTYKTGADKAKEYRRQLKALLNESIGDGLAEWNEYFETDFRSEEDFLDGVTNLTISDPTGALREIRAKAYKLVPQMRFICETPHLILVPIRNPIAIEKDSEVNAAIRELFAMLIVGIALDCSVAVIRDGEELSLTGGEGIARVPPVPALRELVGREWLGLDETQRWVRAIAAAAQVAYVADYPERSNLYHILSSPTPGHILRRIEMKSESSYVPPIYFSYLEAIKEVLS